SYDEDNEIKEIYDILKENLPIPKSIHNHIKHYSIEDNLLYFSVIPEDLQRTLWDNAKAIDKDNKLRDEVSKAAG
ncbi:hypothetical protein BOH78_5321, partial [Pichia kudriavzevii]